MSEIYQADKPLPGRNRIRRLLITVLLVSAAIHVVGLIIFGGTVLFRSIFEKEVQFEAPPRVVKVEPPKREYKVRAKEQQKRSGSPTVQPRLSANRVSDFALPDIKTKVAPVKDAPSAFENSMQSGLGGGFGDGSGDFGLGAEFMGMKSVGKRIAYVIDYSRSMGGAREKRMRTELSESIDALPPGSEFALIFFAGPAWLAGDEAWDVKFMEVGATKGPDRVERRWVFKKGANTGWFPAEGTEMPKAAWIEGTPGNKVTAKRHIRNTKLVLGTDWLPGLEIAHAMQPPPDAIYFMTDGVTQSNDRAVIDRVAQLQRGLGTKIPIYAIAFGEPNAADGMKRLGSRTGGDFRVIEIR